MAKSSLKDLIDWAKSVDDGMSRLEHLVDRYGMLGEELNPEEVLRKFDDIIADVKSTQVNLSLLALLY